MTDDETQVEQVTPEVAGHRAPKGSLHVEALHSFTHTLGTFDRDGLYTVPNGDEAKGLIDAGMLRRLDS